MSQALLQVRGLAAGYVPGVPILHGVDLDLSAGEILAILGPNGAGKSTLIRTIAGLVPRFAGTVALAGEDVSAAPAHRLVRHGFAYVPQVANVFAELTVQENFELGGYIVKGDLGQRIARVLELFPDLQSRRRERAGRLSGGQRQMVAIGRALMIEPKVLALDEPSAGLAPIVVQSVARMIARIAAGGVGVLLVEQNVRAALAIAQRALILAEGKERLSGEARAVAADPAIARIYLGGVAA